MTTHTDPITNAVRLLTAATSSEHLAAGQALQDFAESLGAGGVQPLRPVPSEPSQTAGMNIAQRILHVGGRNNAAGYVEFGSIQAVEALVRQVLRDLPQPAPQQAAPAERKQMTDDELWRFWWARPQVPDGEDDSMEAEFVAAVRKILAAHGIKGGPHGAE